ncbi:MAG TPA: polyprenyl synthetase family protein, partial [Anaeromyxobacteraceae bacterium]|nr:polyprenyl synthetase family protein [Anaeromyxobacteraceae bacterium]
MSKDQFILQNLEASAMKGGRPEKAQAALGQVPGLFEDLGSLERELSRATQDAEATLRAAARHLVGSGGKRIRPMVALLSCGACGGEMAAAVPLAAAAELTHSATLLHDDVIDDGPVRRGQPASRVI